MAEIYRAVLSILTFVLACLTHNLAMAKVYKCEGADGKIEYRQTVCPEDTEQNKMDRLNYKAPKAAPNDNPVSKANKLDQIKLQKRQGQVNSAKERKKDIARCNKYKERLARYKRDGIMGINLVTGEQSVMKGEGARTAMKNAQDNVNIFCS